jgi:flagellar biosynthesis protein FlhA
VLLTIGDGLVAQIPALLLSTASAVIVTRVTSSSLDMGQQFSAQLLDNPKPLAVSAGAVGLLGLIPGMPNVPFLLLAGGLAASAYAIQKRRTAIEDFEAEKMVPAIQPESVDLSWDDVMPVDMIGLEVGYRLIPLVDKGQGGQLMSRIKGIRKKLSQEFGFLVPSVHIRDNLDLAPNAYRISLMGVTVGASEVYPDREMAINPGQVFGALQGIPGKDPAFDLDAVWITEEQKDHAQTLGYTVVDPGTVIATHMSQLIQRHSHELFGHEEAQHLLDTLAKSAPKLAEGLVPKILPLSVFVKVMQNLLKEQIPVRDIRSIAETLAEYGPRSQDPGALTAAVRVALGRLITQKINGITSEIEVITLDPELERLLHKTLENAGENGAGIEPGLAEQMHKSLEESSQKLEARGNAAILLVSSLIRPWMARFVRPSIGALHVLAYNEVPENCQIKVVSMVGQRQA